MKRLALLFALAALLLVGVWLGTRLLGSDATPVTGTSQRAEADAAPAEASAETRVDAPDHGTLERSEVTFEPATVHTAATTGTLLVRTRTGDDEAVPNVRFVLDPRDERRLGAGVRQLMTDADGDARIDALAPGRVRVWSPRGPGASGVIIVGEELELVLEFEGTVDVTGVVVGPDGSPVADADVWIAGWRRDWLASQRVARTGSSGSFTIAFVDEEKSLGASAPGFGPSQLIDLSLTDRSESPIELELSLMPLGGGLRGRVLSHFGRPVAGARVAVGFPPADYSMRMDGTTEEVWGARVAVTDADGAYELRGLPMGVQPVAVSTDAHPQLDVEVEIIAGEVSTLDLTLLHGLQISGVVRDGSGEPVEHAIVLVLDEPFEDQFPTQGPTDSGSPFHRPATRSGADGSFSLEHLMPGDIHIYAAKGASFWDSREDEFLGACQETLNGEAGDALEWDPVLDCGGQIRGRVTYADGESLGSVFVSAFAPNDKQRRFTTSADPDGHFVIPGLESRPYTVHVQLWDPPDDAQPLDQHDVWPSETELVLVASYSKTIEERATVTVRISDDADRLQGEGSVVMTFENGWYYAEEIDGVFTAKIKPGRYQPRIMFADAIVGYGDWFEIGSGEDRDLGTVHTMPGGRLVVRVERVPGVEHGRLWVTVGNDELRQPGRKIAGESSEVTFDGLLAGTMDVWITGGSMAIMRRTIEIEVDSTTELDVQLQRAAKCTLVFDGQPANGWGRMEVVVRDEHGAIYHTMTPRERWAGGLPIEQGLQVPCGRYTVEATMPDGRSASGRFFLESLDDPVTTRFVLE